ncbi:hypothetical protein ABPG72_005204 [Tetrahymena utriculariae]
MDKKLDNLLSFLYDLNDSLQLNKFSVNINFIQLLYWPFKQTFPETGFKYSSELLEHLFYRYQKRLTVQVEHLIIDSRYCIIKKELAKDIENFCQDIYNLQSISLDLKYNQLTSQSGESIASIFLIKKCLQNIHLDLENNLIGDKGLKQILLNIASLPLLINLSLNLRQNELTKKSAHRISQILQKQEHLESLLVNVEQNDINDEGAFQIIQSIQHLSQLKVLSLNLGYNRFTHLEKLRTLRQFQLANLQTFEFSFVNQQFQSMPVHLIHQMTKNSLQLENLFIDLRSNDLSDYSVLCLAASLQKFQFLTSLNINLMSNPIEQLSFKKLIEVCYGFNLLHSAIISHRNFQQNANNNNNQRHSKDCLCYKLQKKTIENKRAILILNAYEKYLKPNLISYKHTNMNLKLNFWDLHY